MKCIRHTPEQIIRKLKTTEQLNAQGKPFADVCRALEVSQPTYHRWRQLYGGMQAEEAKRLDVTLFVGPGAMRVGGYAAECGLRVLYSQRQRSAKAWASATVANSSVLRNSSLNLLL